MIATTMGDVREQAKVTEKEIHSTIESLIATVTMMLRDREAALISNVETVMHQKEKELQLQKDELEFLLSGIRHAVLFSGALVKEGSDTEIVTGHQQVVARMATLTNEREKAQFEPVTEAEIEFVCERESLSSVIKELGAVVSKGISAEQSVIETPIGNTQQINRAYSFKVILVDQKGNKVLAARDREKAVKGLAVAVTGPSQVQVHRTILIAVKGFLQHIFSVSFLHFRPPLKQKKKAERVVR